MKIIIYGTSWCGSCRKQKRALDFDGIPYSYLDMEADKDKLKGKSFNVLPTLEFYDDSGILMKTLAGYHSSEEVLSLKQRVEQIEYCRKENGIKCTEQP